MYRMSFFFSLPSWVEIIFMPFILLSQVENFSTMCLWITRSFKSQHGHLFAHHNSLFKGLSIITPGYCTGGSREFPGRNVFFILLKKLCPISIPGNHWCGYWDISKRWWQNISIHTLGSFHRYLCSQRALWLAWEWTQNKINICTLELLCVMSHSCLAP